MSLEVGSILLDTYRIVRRIDAGGMGEVFEASHARLAGRYAVKVLFRELAEQAQLFDRFKREAEITSALRHPNIVQVIDFNQLADGTPFLVMELLEGQSLADVMNATEGPLPVGAVVLVCEQIASGLAAAHDLGVVHRDLKPGNIFLTSLRGQDRQVAKILDFGISKVKTAAQHLTTDSAVIGTPRYMSPEQAQGKSAEADAASDQFSLATIAYEMLTGARAFAAEETAGIVYKIVFEDPPPMAESGAAVPAPVEAVVRRGMAKSKAERFPSVIEFAKALRAAATVASGGLDRRSDTLWIGAPATPPPAARPSTRSLVGNAKTAAATPGALSGKPESTPRSSISEYGSGELPAITRRRPPIAAITVAFLVTVAGAFAALKLSGGSSSGSSGVPADDTWAGLAPTPTAAARPPATPVSNKEPAAAPPAAAIPAVSPAATALPAAAPVETVQISIKDAPAGLLVTVDGVLRDPPVSLPKGADLHRLRLEAPGFEAKDMQLDAQKDRVIPFLLKPLAGPAPAASPHAATKRKPSASGPAQPARKTGTVINDL